MAGLLLKAVSFFSWKPQLPHPPPSLSLPPLVARIHATYLVTTSVLGALAALTIFPVSGSKDDGVKGLSAGWVGKAYMTKGVDGGGEGGRGGCGCLET